jgi:hypothetical protein
MATDPSAPTTDAPTLLDPRVDAAASALKVTLESFCEPYSDEAYTYAALDAIAEWLRGGATAPTPDDPTDAAVQLAKDLFGYGQHGAACPKSVCDDGACLCCDCGFAEAQSLAAAVLNGLRGGATTWPALDFGACRSLYTDLHEAMAQYGDPDDANRVHDFNRALREHLPVLRGCAGASHE